MSTGKRRVAQDRSPWASGTFYLLVRSPIDDESAFAQRLAQDKVLAMPGTMFEMPGYFRLSITATDDMVERAIPVFEKAISDTR